MAANFLASPDINEKKEKRRRKRRSNLWLNKPKTKERRLFPPGAEDDSSAFPGDRQPACTSSTSVKETPNDQCRSAFHDNLEHAPKKRKTKQQAHQERNYLKIAV
ncbi:hypothetical protein DPMN_086435 [Dreissena polymorpha]|uniref:Uncharacterized protein n=1 Tax=Dreissena polymorpha TaxID=45954 RepID=A0A9D4KR06_DREPO|nr:hypothetical protein DPMN_086435 [Dreissena polymorpha]